MLQRAQLLSSTLLWYLVTVYMGIFTGNTADGYIAVTMMSFSVVYMLARSFCPRIRRPGRLPLLLFDTLAVISVLVGGLKPPYYSIEIWALQLVPAGKWFFCVNLLCFAVTAALITLWEVFRHKITATEPASLHPLIRPWKFVSSDRMSYLLICCGIYGFAATTLQIQMCAVAIVPLVYSFGRCLFPNIRRVGLMPLLSFALACLLMLVNTKFDMCLRPVFPVFYPAAMVFSWKIVICYAIGFALVLLWELLFVYNTKRSSTHENTDPQRLASS